jgi:hypothetical protein
MLNPKFGGKMDLKDFSMFKGDTISSNIIQHSFPAHHFLFFHKKMNAK